MFSARWGAKGARWPGGVDSGGSDDEEEGEEDEGAETAGGADAVGPDGLVLRAAGTEGYATPRRLRQQLQQQQRQRRQQQQQRRWQQQWPHLRQQQQQEQQAQEQQEQEEEQQREPRQQRWPDDGDPIAWLAAARRAMMHELNRGEAPGDMTHSKLIQDELSELPQAEDPLPPPGWLLDNDLEGG
jgi:hypothetical protein